MVPHRRNTLIFFSRQHYLK